MSKLHPFIHSRWMLLLVALTALFLSGCSTIMVLNDTDQDVRIIMSAPDSEGARVSVLRNNSTKGINSVIGGHFFIGMLPDRKLLDDLTLEKTKLQASMLSTDLTAEQQATIRQQIFDIRQKIDEAEAAAKKSTAVCTGNVMEFGSVNATVYLDQATGNLALSCVINKPDINTGGE